MKEAVQIEEKEKKVMGTLAEWMEREGLLTPDEKRRLLALIGQERRMR